ncbi:cardioacceleratory peptide receptor-like [Ixodes scapularis]
MVSFWPACTVRVVVLRQAPGTFRRFFRPNSKQPGEQAPDCIRCRHFQMGEKVFGSWVLGGVACKAIVYLQIVTLASTTFILTSMSYDRYMAICKPLESRSGLRRARCMVAASWVMAFVFATPQLFIFVQVQTGVTASGRPHLECLSVGYTHHWQRQLYFSWLTLYILVVPGLLISAFYLSLLRAVWAASDAIAVTPAKDSGNGATTLRRCTRAEPLLSRARAKTLKLTVCIIASFVVCWIPYFAVHNVRIHSHYCIKVPRAVIVFAETLALLNSAVNPVFYGLFNAHIRRGLRDIIRACRRRSDLGPERESTMRKGGNAFTTSTYAAEASSGDCFPGQPLKTIGSIGAGKSITNGDIAVV